MSDVGAGVYVNGVIVAWFAEFDESARDWCAENHFGEWLVLPATKPTYIPPTQEQIDRCEKEAEKLASKIRECENYEH